ncbi:MAG: glycosyltransferase family 2 protein [Mycobacterium leprae]
MDWEAIFWLSPGAEDIPAAESAPDGVGRAADLKLPEFKACMQSQPLRGDMQWAVPFVLSRACLTETMAVLDCSTGATGLPERMAELYPNVLCRRFDPLNGRNLALPVGLPDEAFDRVVCVGTLDKLSAADQMRLIDELTTKLKPGGLLLLSWPHYYTPEAASVPGYTAVDLTKLSDLTTMTSPKLGKVLLPTAVPDRTTAGLLWVDKPANHIVIGSVLQKLPKADMPKGRKLLLGLLTWNSQGTSIGALQALVREARMLKRMGQDVSIAVFDNGSDDGSDTAGGTTKRLQDLKAAMDPADVAVSVITNTKNDGSAVGRNRLITEAQTQSADYLLLCDADVTIVPFSVFAMLRYMESYGHWLGGVGMAYTGAVTQRSKAAEAVSSLGGLSIDRSGARAPVHYGLFRKAVLDAGVKCDTAGPLGVPGWGFADLELALQMQKKGFQVHTVGGLPYLHQNQHHSIYLLRAAGTDVEANFELRRTALLTKWTFDPGDWRTALLRNERLPE